MAKQNDLGITILKEEDISEWYNQVIIKGKVADFSPVKGCMVMRPSGYFVWQKIQDYFNKRLELNNVDNTYFPMLIPKSFIVKEAEHLEGFAPELAEINKGDEPLVIRPTSETIIYDTLSRWIRSHRDLPMKVHQWANVLRWESKMTKLFLRSREFLWQEGHTVHETEEEAKKEAKLWLEEYVKLFKELLAVPVLSGKKPECEKFAGAVDTYTIEAMMPDGKSAQAGTTHYLGQNFAKAFNIEYQANNKKHYPYQTSWGISTRSIGTMLMLHSDNKGVIFPPNVAKTQVVIVPLLFKNKEKPVLERAKEIESKLKQKNIRVLLDDDSKLRHGFKFHQYELEGVPIRIEIGPKDIENEACVISVRDKDEKSNIAFDDLDKFIIKELKNMQERLYENALKIQKEKIVEIDNLDNIEEDKFNLIPVDSEKTIEEISEKINLTARLIKDEELKKDYICPLNGRKATMRVYFSREY